MGKKAWWTGGRASRWCLGHTFSRRLGWLLASEGCPSLRPRQFFSPHCAWKMGRVLGLIVQGAEMPTLASPLLVFTSPGASSRTARAIYGHQGSPDPTYPSQGSSFSELILNPFSPRLTDPCWWALQEGLITVVKFLTDHNGGRTVLSAHCRLSLCSALPHSPVAFRDLYHRMICFVNVF